MVTEDGPHGVYLDLSAYQELLRATLGLSRPWDSQKVRAGQSRRHQDLTPYLNTEGKGNPERRADLPKITRPI